MFENGDLWESNPVRVRVTVTVRLRKMKLVGQDWAACQKERRLIVRVRVRYDV